MTTFEPWALNNFFGVSFSIQGIKSLSLGSYKVGAILLAGLFLYDIFWVFGTEVMVTVARSFEAPIKLLFMRAFATDDAKAEGTAEEAAAAAEQEEAAADAADAEDAARAAEEAEGSEEGEEGSSGSEDSDATAEESEDDSASEDASVEDDESESEL